MPQIDGLKPSGGFRKDGVDTGETANDPPLLLPAIRIFMRTA